MRKFYKGAFYPDLEAAFIEEIRSIKKHPLDETTVLVPSLLLKEHLPRLITMELGASAGVNFVNFDELAKPHIRKALSTRKLKRIPKRAATLLLKRAAEQTLTNGDKLNSLITYHGLPSALWDTIADMKEAQVTYSDLEVAADEISLPDPVKVKEISRVWTRYEEIKDEAGLLDEKDCLQLALKELEYAPPKLDAPLFIYGIYDATNLQLELIKAFVEKNDAVAFIPWFEQFGNFVSPYIRFISKKLGFTEVDAPKTESKPAPLKNLCDRAFTNFPTIISRDFAGHIELLSAGGQYEEAKECVRKIINVCREQNIYFDEVGIVLRNGDAYRPLFIEVLRKSGLPFRLTAGLSLSRSPGGKTMKSFLDLVSKKKRAFGTVSEFIDGAALAPANGKEIPGGLWMRLAREAGISNWAKNWEDKLDSLVNLKKKQIEQKDDESDPAEKLKTDVAEAKNFIDYAKKLFRTLDGVAATASWKETAAKIKSAFLFYADQNVWGANKTIELLNKLIRLGDSIPESTGAELIAAIYEALDDEAISHPDESKHGIVVSEIMQSRATPFKIAVVPGLCRGSFPAPFREDPLFLDEERNALRAYLKNRPTPELKGRRAEEERLLFLLALSAAKNKVILSFPRNGAVGGKEFVESSFINIVRKIMGVEFSKSEPQIAEAVNGAEAFELLAEANPASLSELDDYKRRLSAIRKRDGSALTDYDGLINDGKLIEKIIASFKNKDGWIFSPSKLEEYARCPFKFLLSRVLRLIPGAELAEEDEIDSLGIGALYHRILFKYYTYMRDAGKLPIKSKTDDDWLEHLRRIAEYEFEAFEREGNSELTPIIWKINKRAVLNDLEAVVKEDINSDWTPSYFEAQFGLRRKGDFDEKLRSEDPLKIELDDETPLFVSGKIDRIDVSADKKTARVIDYKTGSTNGYTKNDLKGGAYIQPSIYALAAEKLLENKNIKCDEAMYWFINRKKEKKNRLKTISHSDTRDQLINDLKLLLKCMESGQFHQFKDNKQGNYRECSCQYSRACVENANSVFFRKCDDPVLNLWRLLKKVGNDESAD